VANNVFLINFGVKWVIKSEHS